MNHIEILMDRLNYTEYSICEADMGWSQKQYNYIDINGLHCLICGDRWSSKGKIVSVMCRSF